MESSFLIDLMWTSCLVDGNKKNNKFRPKANITELNIVPGERVFEWNGTGKQKLKKEFGEKFNFNFRSFFHPNPKRAID